MYAGVVWAKGLPPSSLKADEQAICSLFRNSPVRIIGDVPITLPHLKIKYDHLGNESQVVCQTARFVPALKCGSGRVIRVYLPDSEPQQHALGRRIQFFFFKKEIYHLHVAFECVTEDEGIPEENKGGAPCPPDPPSTVASHP